MTLRTESLVDRITDAFFALDTEFRFTYLNDRAETLLERSRGEVIGKVLWNEFPDAAETQFPEQFHRAMTEQVPVSFEFYHTHIETWLETRAYPSKSGLSVLMQDITERKRQETTLAQHAAVVEAIDDAVFTLDRTREIVTVNEALERCLGVNRTDLIGEHVEVIPQLAAIDDADASDIRRAITTVSQSATSETLNVPYTEATGTDRVGELRIVPVEDDVASVAVVMRDVTDRHEYQRVAASLHEITRWLLESDDPEEICAIAVHAGSELLELPISGSWLLDTEQGYLDPVAGTAGAYDEFGGLPRFHQNEGLVWEAFESGEVRSYNDLHTVDGLYNDRTPLRSEIIAPIGTHGVLMTGSLQPNRFDETDVELLSTLAENTTAALDRAERERVLRKRSTELERQAERLEAIAAVLSIDLKEKLQEIAVAVEGDDWQLPLTDEPVEETLERTEQLVDDVREFARNATAVKTRSRLELTEAVNVALERAPLPREAITVVDDATLRANPEGFVHLIEAALEDVAERAEDDVCVEIGVLEGEETARPEGFFVTDDAAASPPPRDHLLDPAVDRATATSGLGVTLVYAIAEAHDWTCTIDSTGEQTRLEISGVTTLEVDD